MSRTRQRGLSMWAWLFILLLVFVVFGLLSGGGSSTDSRATQGNKPARQPSANELALQGLRIDKWTSRKAGFGNVLEIDLVIENTGSRPVKDVAIACSVYGQSGTQIGRAVQVLYQRFETSKKTKVSGVNMGLINSQSASASCEIVAAEAL